MFEFYKKFFKGRKAFPWCTAFVFCACLYNGNKDDPGSEIHGTWIVQASGTTNVLNSVQFTDTNTGYAVGDHGLILKTSNGGTHWSAQDYGANYVFTSLAFVNPDTGFIAGWGPFGGFILKTLDGGELWNLFFACDFNACYSDDYYGIRFLDANTGYIVGENGAILKTTDGGKFWTDQSLASMYYRLNSVDFVNADTGFVAGANGRILKTVNGGTVWDTLTSGTIKPLNAIHFVDAHTGYVAGNGGTLRKTMDGGATWKAQTCGKAWSLHSISFTDRNTGFAAGDSAIYATADGGDSWILQAGVSQNLLSLHFLNSHTGWAVGSGGAILKYTGE